MRKQIRLALAQINCTVGDLAGNCEKICRCINRAEAAGADIISFPELAVTGYPPEDLLLKFHFVERNIDALKRIAKCVGDIAAIVGFADRRGTKVFNSAAVLCKGKIIAIYHKMLLPNYGVFDEVRYFKFGEDPLVFKMDDVIFGVNICEDIWHHKGPIKEQSKKGANLIITINSSPYHIGKIKERERIIQSNAKKSRVFISYVNMAGGQDEIVFDGRSMVVDNNGRIIARAKAFEEDLLMSDIQIEPLRRKHQTGLIEIKKRLSNKAVRLNKTLAPALDNCEEVYRALLLGLRDYVSKVMPTDL